MNKWNEWERRLHDELNEHETLLPADGWQRLAHDLSVRARHRRLWRAGGCWAAGVAAAFALFFVIRPQQVDVPKAERTALADRSAAHTPARQTALAVASEPGAGVGRQEREPNEEKFIAAAVVPAEETVGTASAVSAAAADGADSVPTAKPSATQGKMAPVQRRAQAVPVVASASQPDAAGMPRKAETTFTFAAAGGPAGVVRQAGYAFLPQLSQQDAVQMGQVFAVFAENSRKDVRSRTSHKWPLRFTFGVSLPLGRGKCAVETGLSYTRFRSDMESGTTEAYYATRQTLHYIGVPLRPRWDLCDIAALNLYAVAGGSMAVCVSGSQTTDYVLSGNSVGPHRSVSVGHGVWQAPLEAAAGVQVGAGRHWAIFAEPGPTYYVPDGSSLPSAYRDCPFAFSFQAGLRWTVK